MGELSAGETAQGWCMGSMGIVESPCFRRRKRKAKSWPSPEETNMVDTHTERNTHKHTHTWGWGRAFWNQLAGRLGYTLALKHQILPCSHLTRTKILTGHGLRAMEKTDSTLLVFHLRCVFKRVCAICAACVQAPARPRRGHQTHWRLLLQGS